MLVFFLPPQPSSGPSTVNNRRTPSSWHRHCRPRAVPPTCKAPPLISRSVQIYYCIDPIPFSTSNPLPPFVPRVSSFYILAASAKQLMCTECVDSNCLAIVAPFRSRLLLFASALAPRPKRDEALDHRAVRTNPAAFFRSILLSFRDKSTLPLLLLLLESVYFLGAFRSIDRSIDRASENERVEVKIKEKRFFLYDF